MTYKDMFDLSAEAHPNGGIRFSPAHCGFLEPEIAALVKKYEKELKDLTDPEIGGNQVLARMVEAHLVGLREIQRMLNNGESNKPDQ